MIVKGQLSHFNTKTNHFKFLEKVLFHLDYLDRAATGPGMLRPSHNSPRAKPGAMAAGNKAEFYAKAQLSRANLLARSKDRP